MPLGDVAEQNAFIAAYFGAVTSGIPTSFSVALWTGNPYVSGSVEFSYPGYGRQTITNATDWSTAANGSTTATVTFPDATDAATTDDALAWVLFNGTAVTAWEFLDGAVEVDGAGSIEPIGVTVYNPNVDLDAIVQGP